MTYPSAWRALLPAILCCWVVHAHAWALDVAGKRFDPPRIYFSHSSLNKNGTTSAIKGQANFLHLYVPAIDNQTSQYTPDGFSYTILLPAFVECLDPVDQKLTIKDVQWQGKPYQEITRTIDARQIESRCLNAEYGTDSETIWYRIDPKQQIPAEPIEIQVTLNFKGKECHTDTSRLKVYDELVAPKLPAKYFKLWLHSGPFYRVGKYDEMADWYGKAGFNAIQSMETLEFNIEMRKRGFYMIHQRGGSYMRVYDDDFRQCVIDGPAWFDKEDGGVTEQHLPHVDAVLWDFEPGAANRISGINMDPWFIDRFRKEYGIPADTKLTEEIIRAKFLKQWIDFRQNIAAQTIKNWADWSRSIHPSIETIVTEGVAHFDLVSHVDYGKFSKHVTYCDPMNFVGASTLQDMKKWMAHVPDGQFMGCQNVSGGGAYYNVFVSDRDIMLQTMGAALIGCKGTSVFPGWTMDAANFVLFNRVMSFLAHHQGLIFEGAANPAGIAITPLYKDDTEIELGDGTKTRNTYPDWDHDANIKAYQDKSGDFLVVINNLNKQEPCHVKVQMPQAQGQWVIVDDENRAVFTLAGKSQVPSEALTAGVYFECPPHDFRGFAIRAASAEANEQIQNHHQVPLEQGETKAMAYARSGTGAGEALASGKVSLEFDDFNQDKKFEYLVQSPGQKVWIGQNGTILQWQIGDQTLRTEQLGLFRDMIWLPQAERSNTAMDAAMRLDKKEISQDRVELVFSKSASLDSLGGMVGLKFVKQFIFSPEPGDLKVKVTVFNDSLAMDVPSVNLSYRVHNFLNYEASDKTIVWVNDAGGRLVQRDDGQTHSTINANLTPQETDVTFRQAEVIGPHRIASFGEYFPRQKLLLAIHPRDPARILQLLRWERTERSGGVGTIEWMYRPETLPQGKDLSYEFRVLLRTDIDELSPASVQPASNTEERAALDPHLLFHADFETGPDAVVAKGASAKASVKGRVAYEDAPAGKAIRLNRGASVHYLPEGNINLQKGKIYIHFKPLWHGGDGVSRYLIDLPVLPGRLYLGKLDDGRLLLNLFDKNGEQHWPSHSIRDMEPGGWHKLTATWDATQGTMQLYLDGRRVAEGTSNPWQMGQLKNSVDDCRISIGGAPIVIDEVKIWDQP